MGANEKTRGRRGAFRVLKRSAAAFSTALLLLIFASPLDFDSSAAAEPVYASLEASCKPARLTADRLVPVGRTAGIKIYADGAIITDFSEVQTENGMISPARDAGLQVGDVITHVNGKAVASSEELIAAVNSASGAVDLTVLRGGQTIRCRMTPCKELGGSKMRIGAFVRDSVAGIGTITFYDPVTGVFGALGHGISESETGALMPLGSGCLIPSTVTGVHRGEHGAPGELVGSFDLSRDSGRLHNNLDTWLFGVLGAGELYPDLLSAEAVPVAKAGEVKVGKAEILANVSGSTVKSYEIEIVKLLGADKTTKNMYIRVTDAELIEATGGIVQGMSGSPILQNGKIIGAVTHVLVSDPEYGYGIFIENMLDTAYSDELKNAA